MTTPPRYIDLQAEQYAAFPVDDPAFHAMLGPYVQQMISHLHCLHRAIGFRTDSPIEAALGRALMFCQPSFGVHGAGSGMDEPDRLVIRPQFEVGPFRLDFAVWIADGWDLSKPSGGVRLAVECDGHAFHEKTPAQAARDKRRERYLVERGWRVMRFTGREILADPMACARQVCATVDRLAANAIHADLVSLSGGAS